MNDANKQTFRKNLERVLPGAITRVLCEYRELLKNRPDFSAIADQDVFCIKMEKKIIERHKALRAVLAHMQLLLKLIEIEQLETVEGLEKLKEEFQSACAEYDREVEQNGPFVSVKNDGDPE